LSAVGAGSIAIAAKADGAIWFDECSEHQEQDMRSRMTEFARTKSLVGVLVAAMLLPFAAVAAPAESAAPVPQVLSDGVGASPATLKGLNRVRYIEIFLAAKDPKTGKLVAPCYNSTASSAGVPASKDTAPQAKVEGLDMEKLKAEYGVLGASLNGPKLWMLDWVEVEIGVQREFNGIHTAWVAQLNMDKDVAVDKMEPYKPMTIARKSGLGWSRGNTVMLIDDASGNTWVMKGFQLGLTPRHTYEQFLSAGAGNFKSLPPGWKFRIKTLDEDLVERPANGVATIMSDEFFNVYDRTGPGMTNYTP
jgi:hypothetical protein